MKKALLAALLFVSSAATPTTAHCAACFTNPCITAAFCGRGCTCMKRGLDVMGECVSFERALYDVRQEEEKEDQDHDTGAY